MTDSYTANIERIRKRATYNTRQRIQQGNEQVRTANLRGAQEAETMATQLSEFSTLLKEWKERDIKKKTAQGVKLAQTHQQANAEKIAALAEELARTKEEDTRYHEIKGEMLRLGGPSVYPDADRVANLSPWQQVGYAKEKLRTFNNTFDDKLAHAMQNSEKAITIAGVTFTPKELRDNNIQGLPFKEAAAKVLSEDIRKAANVDMYTPEMQALAGTDAAIIKAQEGQMAKYRERYNIDASSNTRLKAQREWASSPKSSEDLYRLFLIQSHTVDDNNELLGNTGAWDSVMTTLANDGIESGDAYFADKVGALELPENLRRQLGAKKGTTFAQQWPGRFKKLKADIKKGIVEENNAELKFQETAGTALTTEFIKEARENPGGLDTARVNEFKRRFGELGLPIPSDVTKYETASMRDEREDAEKIKLIMATNNGFISNEQLDEFHPLAALEHREKATRMEKAAIEAFDSEAKIKAHLNTAFTDMGIKANEKSPAWVEALSNAKADYTKQYWNYVAMGYEPAEASYLALRGKRGEIKTPDGETIQGNNGVLTEIEQNGATNKYVIAGQNVEKSIKPGTLRVARIRSGKEEILNDPSIVTKGVIGGDYGHRQITSIRTNIEKYGRRGLYMDKGALQYYKGLARGRNPREGGWWALVDAQLKSTGHEGLNPADRPRVMSFFTGKDENNNIIPDKNGSSAINRQVSRSLLYPSRTNKLYAMNQLKDNARNLSGVKSVWDEPDNWPSWLQLYSLGGVL